MFRAVRARAPTDSISRVVSTSFWHNQAGPSWPSQSIRVNTGQFRFYRMRARDSPRAIKPPKSHTWLQQHEELWTLSWWPRGPAANILFLQCRNFYHISCCLICSHLGQGAHWQRRIQSGKTSLCNLCHRPSVAMAKPPTATVAKVPSPVLLLLVLPRGSSRSAGFKQTIRVHALCATPILGLYSCLPI